MHDIIIHTVHTVCNVQGVCLHKKIIYTTPNNYCAFIHELKCVCTCTHVHVVREKGSRVIVECINATSDAIVLEADDRAFATKLIL